MPGRTYNYEIQSNVAGANAFFNLLVSFAVTCGWTVVTSQSNKEWLSDGDGTYSWQAGNDQYAEILSTGYGSQSLRWRLHMEYEDAAEGRLWMRGCDLSDYAVDDTDSVKPYAQKCFRDDYVGYGNYPLPYATMQKVHFIGDETMIFFWFQYSTLVGYGGALGTWELDEEWQNTTQGLADFVANCASGSSAVSAMINPNSAAAGLGIPFTYRLGSGTSCGSTTSFKKFYMFDYVVPQRNVALSLGLTNDEYSTFGYTDCNAGFNAHWLLGRNDYSQKRPLVQPSISMVDQAGVGRFVFVGHLPCYLCDFSGLTMGQILTYGTDKYVVFPHNSVLKPYGFAMKVDI